MGKEFLITLWALVLSAALVFATYIIIDGFPWLILSILFVAGIYNEWREIAGKEEKQP